MMQFIRYDPESPNRRSPQAVNSANDAIGAFLFGLGIFLSVQ
jgi:hypothetical protein